ncbi:VOC family protein [Streptomyces sp. HNM0575]|uniref:VOC family protein n=1 Tax=Streptomyces sp. HNM0575 TaxID=2716338 RepID=UPI00145E31C8|nr:VOC family protein [Streptomyces sp. HNM0575]NLU72996.1 VOC family protein [Streptomyces sp. HNM0575]
MPEVTERYEPGVPCWVDLMVPDQQAALDFYKDLFGWQGEIGPPESGGYSVCTLHDKPVAGVMATMAGEGEAAPPPAWTMYLATDDVDAAAHRVTQNGGTMIVEPVDVMDLGRMAVAEDPTGAVFGLWQAKDFKGSQIVSEHGAVVWSELNTSGLDEAKSFYRNLGIETTPMEGAPGYNGLAVGGRTVGGMQGLENSPPGTPSHWITYFAIDDTDSAVDALIRRDGSVLVPPYDMMAGRMAVVQDPQGAVFALIKPVPMQNA